MMATEEYSANVFMAGISDSVPGKGKRKLLFRGCIDYNL